MPVKHVLQLTFSPSLVKEPEISKMIRALDVVVNVGHTTIHNGHGEMLLHVLGQPGDVQAAEKFLSDAGVRVQVRQEEATSEPLPDVPRTAIEIDATQVTSRKLWLTFSTELVDRPILWEMSRRFAVEFDIRQCSIGEKVGIVGLMLCGPEDELDAACDYLSSIGVEVEPIEKSVGEG